MSTKLLSDAEIEAIADSTGYCEYARAIEAAVLAKVAPASVSDAENQPIGQILSEAEMFNAKADGKAGNVFRWNKPKSGLIYAAPAQSTPDAWLMEMLNLAESYAQTYSAEATPESAKAWRALNAHARKCAWPQSTKQPASKISDAEMRIRKEGRIEEINAVEAAQQPDAGEPEAITYNPVYGSVQEGRHPSKGIVYLRATAPQVVQGDDPSNISPLSDFYEGQWWVNELDALASSRAATADQKRAVATVHHMLRSAAMAFNAARYPDVEPFLADGHDHEGFVGGCERFGHTPETCLDKLTQVAQGDEREAFHHRAMLDGYSTACNDDSSYQSVNTAIAWNGFQMGLNYAAALSRQPSAGDAKDDEREHIICYLASQGHDKIAENLIAGMSRAFDWPRFRAALATKGTK